jgi:hypothetical protein
MLKFRIMVLESILNAPDPNHVRDAMKAIFEGIQGSDVSDRRFSHCMKSVKSDVFFQMRLKQSRREFNNLAEALKMIHEGINLEKALY